MLKTLADDGDIAVLLIEQNLGVALDVADDIAVMVNGRIARVDAGRRVRRRPRAAAAAARRALGCGDETRRRRRPRPKPPRRRAAGLHDPARRRRSGAAVRRTPTHEPRTVRGFTRWNSGDAASAVRATGWSKRAPSRASRHRRSTDARRRLADTGRDARVLEFPVATSAARAAYIAGTFDTKGRELLYLRNCLEKLGVRTVTVDLSTSGQPSLGDGASARGRAPPPGRRTRGVHRRSRLGGRGDGHRLRGVRHAPARPRRADLRRRLGRHRAGHGGDAPAARRRAQGDGVHRGVGRREALRRAVRHLHDVLGHRHRRASTASRRRCSPMPRTRSPA